MVSAPKDENDILENKLMSVPTGLICAADDYMLPFTYHVGRIEKQ